MKPKLQSSVKLTVEQLEDRTVPSVITQLTNSTGGFFTGQPASNADGTRIAFTSDRDLVGTNVDGTQEIFLFDNNTGATTQITNVANGFPISDSASISADGTRIAFRSNSDLVPGNNSDGGLEIFLFDTVADAFTQITNTTGTLFNDLAINANGDQNFEIYLFDTAADAFTQITNTPGNTSDQASISADGTRIAFRSLADPVGTNSDANPEIFLFDADCPNPHDFSDAPDTGTGTGAGNYHTLDDDNGPSHTIVVDLQLGATIEGLRHVLGEHPGRRPKNCRECLHS